jgi:hypothetical protein
LQHHLFRRTPVDHLLIAKLAPAGWRVHPRAELSSTRIRARLETAKATAALRPIRKSLVGSRWYRVVMARALATEARQGTGGDAGFSPGSWEAGGTPFTVRHPAIEIDASPLTGQPELTRTKGG